MYVLDLRSDVRRNPKIAGTTHNVFGIQTGVAIGFFVREKSKLNTCDIHYAHREDAELAKDKLAYLREANLQDISFQIIVPDDRYTWLNKSESDFQDLIELANRDTKFVKTASQQNAVFRLYSLGIATNRDAWHYDLDLEALGRKVRFFCDTYESERKRFAIESPDEGAVGDWVDRSIKWTSELEDHLVKSDSLEYDPDNIVAASFRPFVSKYSYYAPIFTHRRYQQTQIHPEGREGQNEVICFCVNRKNFYVLGSDKIVDLHFTGDTQCLPLYRYTPEGDRISNITEWGLSQVRGRYSDNNITTEDIFAYTYAALHDPKYREAYAVDLLQGFPRLFLHDDFREWVRLGQELLNLHIGYESAPPWNLHQVEQQKPPGKPRLRADKVRGTITLDNQTSLTGIPDSAWEYRLGSRSALEWILDQYKERTPRDPTIREHFNTYRFADHKEHVIDLLKRVCTVSVETVRIVNQLAELSDIEPTQTQGPEPEVITLTRTGAVT